MSVNSEENVLAENLYRYIFLQIFPICLDNIRFLNNIDPIINAEYLWFHVMIHCNKWLVDLT